ncbi:MAG: radical SAM protein [Thermodesulfobacteriota bacterium]
MRVSEIFFSIQGESTYAGLPCIFIRLAGCNIRCAWCDTHYAQDRDGGAEFSHDDIVNEIKKYNCSLVEITGGEPLLQDGTLPLLNKILELDYEVLLETNGTKDIQHVDTRVKKIVDVKCPSSGYGGSFLMKNLDFIIPNDEIKFVMADRNDYEFSKGFLKMNIKDKTHNILFAPAYPEMDQKELSKWILEDGLKVRLQPQLHRHLREEGKESPNTIFSRSFDKPT